MRIIGGVARGRPLASVAGPTRPTSDRAREGLFSSLLSEFGDFEELNFLDLFAGSGAIGLEALSRGASTVHVVEKDENASGTIRTNADLVKKGNTLGGFHLFAMSAQRFLESPAPMSYDIVYVDPPYDFPDGDLYKCLSELREGGFLSDVAVIAVERASKSSPVEWPEGFEPLRERNYGQAVIYYGSPTPENG